SRTLLLNARPPAMGSPPGTNCLPRRPAHRAVDPSLGSARGQGMHGAHWGVGLVLALGRHGLEAPREAVHHEVVSRGVEAPVHERGEHEEEPEEDSCPGGHAKRSFLVPSPRRGAATTPMRASPSAMSPATRSATASNSGWRAGRESHLPSTGWTRSAGTARRSAV